MTMKDNELYSFLQLCGAVQYLLSCFTASRGSARYGLCSNTVVLLFFLTMYSELKLPHLIVNNVRMRRRVQGIDGLQDVVSQISQVYNGTGYNCLHTGCASH